ncbi:MAG: nucleoside-diphosphate kinase [Patescibacteria group bacterium]|nr:nucleoside-diphosphate kinase [Patescibacteria group bacterium]
MKKEKTLILVKPDGVQRGLIGNIINRFEDKGLKMIGLKMITLNDVLLEAHYSHLTDKPFFGEIKNFMKSSPIVAMAWEGGEGTVSAVRILVGPTKGQKAPAGTIRGDYGLSGSNNIVHASDSVDNGEIEVERFFKKEELFEYEKTQDLHIYGKK